jgi:hypothetical protein
LSFGKSPGISILIRVAEEDMCAGPSDEHPPWRRARMVRVPARGRAPAGDHCAIWDARSLDRKGCERRLFSCHVKRPTSGLWPICARTMMRRSRACARFHYSAAKLKVDALQRRTQAAMHRWHHACSNG